jgi:hypothetical protein
MDNCGICGGDNRTCYENRGNLETPKAYGYNELIRIPASSTNIYIRRSRNREDIGCLGNLDIIIINKIIKSFENDFA